MASQTPWPSLLSLLAGPLLLAIAGLLLFLNPEPGSFADLAGAVLLVLALVAGVLALLVWAAVRHGLRKELPWPLALAASVGCVILAFAILRLFA